MDGILSTGSDDASRVAGKPLLIPNIASDYTFDGKAAGIRPPFLVIASNRVTGSTMTSIGSAVGVLPVMQWTDAAYIILAVTVDQSSTGMRLSTTSTGVITLFRHARITDWLFVNIGVI